MPRHPRQAGTFVLLLAAPVFAQFSEFATTDDGSQLYFTSRMWLKGRQSGVWREARLYRFGPDGLTLYAERGKLAPENVGCSNDGVHYPSVSGDGAVVGLAYENICGDPECLATVNRIEIRGSQSFAFGPRSGHVEISRNGRWALVTAGVFPEATTTLVDLSTGQRTTAPVGPPFVFGGGDSRVRLANDGSFLATVATQIAPNTTVVEFVIWKQGKMTPLRLERLTPFGLSDDGATVMAYGHASGPGPDRIVLVSLASGAVTTVAQAQAPDRFPLFLSASIDARRVLYTMASPDTLSGAAYIWDSAAASTVGLSLDPGESVNSGVLSGNGEIAFLATTLARIVRFDLASKATSTLFPPPPYCDDPGPIANGSYTRLRCSFAASVSDLTGKFVIDGVPAPILSSTAGDLAIQVPWHRSLFSPSILSIDLPSESAFVSTGELDTYPGAPATLGDNRGLFGMAIVKGDWSGPAAALPAAGELFHIYMTGLGPVKTSETTGVPASTTRPNPIEWTLACEFLPGRQAADPLFVGLAPGMLGIYQTSFRMPPGVAEATGFQCALRSPVMRVTFGPGLPVLGIYGSGFIAGLPVTAR